MPNLYPSDPDDSDVFNHTTRREAEADESRTTSASWQPASEPSTLTPEQTAASDTAWDTSRTARKGE